MPEKDSSSRLSLQHIVIIITLMFILANLFNGISRQQAKEQRADEALKSAAATRETETTRSTTVATTTEPEPELYTVTAVGDSMMVGAVPHLQSKLKEFNYQAKVGIQMSEGISYLQSLKKADQVGDVILISLGSNGPISAKQIDTVMELADGRPVYAMNIVVGRSWMSSVNSAWAEGAKRHENLTVVDWAGYVSAHPSVLRADGVHATPSGYGQYANLFLDELPGSTKK